MRYGQYYNVSIETSSYDVVGDRHARENMRDAMRHLILLHLMLLHGLLVALIASLHARAFDDSVFEYVRSKEGTFG